MRAFPSLAKPAVLDFYQSAYRDCRIVNSRTFPSARSVSSSSKHGSSCESGDGRSLGGHECNGDISPTDAYFETSLPPIGYALRRHSAGRLRATQAAMA
jgi:hypothetical protein